MNQFLTVLKLSISTASSEKQLDQDLYIILPLACTVESIMNRDNNVEGVNRRFIEIVFYFCNFYCTNVCFVDAGILQNTRAPAIANGSCVRVYAFDFDSKFY